MSSAHTEQAKAALLKAHADRLKEQHLDWSFVRCWQTAQAGHPELVEDFEGEATTAAVPVYRYVEDGKPTSTSKAALRELLADFGEETVRVEA